MKGCRLSLPAAFFVLDLTAVCVCVCICMCVCASASASASASDSACLLWCVCVCVCARACVGLGGIRVDVVQAINSSEAVDMDRGCGRATLRQPYRIHDQGQVPVQATLRRQQRRGRPPFSFSVSPCMSAKCAADTNVDVSSIVALVDVSTI